MTEKAYTKSYYEKYEMIMSVIDRLNDGENAMYPDEALREIENIIKTEEFIRTGSMTFILPEVYARPYYLGKTYKFVSPFGKSVNAVVIDMRGRSDGMVEIEVEFNEEIELPKCTENIKIWGEEEV